MEKQIDDYLQHIRLIHFSLLIVCGTIGYLVLSTWSKANDLIYDLNEFSAVLQKMQAKESNIFLDIIPNWKELGVDPLRKSIESRIGSKIALSAESTKILRLLSIEPESLTTGSLEQIRARLENMRITIETVESINSDLSDIQNWIQPKSEFDPTLEIAVQSWPTDANSGSLNILAHTSYKVLGVDPQSGNPKELIEKHDHLFENKEWTSTKHTIPLPPEWVQRKFPGFIKYWENIKSLSIERAITWAESQRTEALKSRNPNLFGIEVKGEHLGYVGPLLVGCLLLYLLSFLTQLRDTLNTVRNNEPFSMPILSPWIGTMKNFWAITVTWATLLLFPVIGVGLPIWRLLGQSAFRSALIAVFAIIIGYKCALISASLAFHKTTLNQNQNSQGTTPAISASTIVAPALTESKESPISISTVATKSPFNSD